MGLAGCAHHHAAWLLECWGTTVWDRQNGRAVKIVVGRRRRRRHSRRIYDAQTVAALTKLWRHFGLWMSDDTCTTASFGKARSNMAAHTCPVNLDRNRNPSASGTVAYVADERARPAAWLAS